MMKINAKEKKVKKSESRSYTAKNLALQIVDNEVETLSTKDASLDVMKKESKKTLKSTFQF